MIISPPSHPWKFKQTQNLSSYLVKVITLTTVFCKFMEEKGRWIPLIMVIKNIFKIFQKIKVVHQSK